LKFATKNLLPLIALAGYVLIGLGPIIKPERFNDGELVVIADSAAWATQVRLLTSAVLRRLNEELGHGTVTRVVVRGPAPPRRMGPLRVRGTREHNDDYG